MSLPVKSRCFSVMSTLTVLPMNADSSFRAYPPDETAAASTLRLFTISFGSCSISLAFVPGLGLNLRHVGHVRPHTLQERECFLEIRFGFARISYYYIRADRHFRDLLPERVHDIRRNPSPCGRGSSPCIPSRFRSGPACAGTCRISRAFNAPMISPAGALLAWFGFIMPKTYEECAFRLG